MYAYRHTVRTTNPGSVALFKTLTPDPNGPSKFQRFFVNLFEQKQGFLFGCRPFTGLDGCHLKRKYLGVLLAANAIDANLLVFPLAVAICETECKNSWSYFITDRQKGVVDAIEIWWPGSSNRFSVRHIFANLRARHRGNNLSDIVFKAAKSTNKADFDEAMKEMRETDMDAYNYISMIHVCH
ncbi:hypothetical protein ACOSQ2_003566 [Xanthoceras sorbifolium]